MASGCEKTEMHSPVSIEGSYLGNGVGSVDGSVDGKIRFDARKMLNRPALLGTEIRLPRLDHGL